MSPDNVRRMLEETVAAAEALCLSGGLPPLGHITPHALRRTNTSLLAAAGADPAWIMEQVGHTDPKLTLRIYTQVMKRKRSEEYRARANELLGVTPKSSFGPGPTNDKAPLTVPIGWAGEGPESA
jgi:integrase